MNIDIALSLGVLLSVLCFVIHIFKDMRQLDKMSFQFDPTNNPPQSTTEAVYASPDRVKAYVLDFIKQKESDVSEEEIINLIRTFRRDGIRNYSETEAKTLLTHILKKTRNPPHRSNKT